MCGVPAAPEYIKPEEIKFQPRAIKGEGVWHPESWLIVGLAKRSDAQR